eukprot:6173504-Pleurochrysis_carterae.AAC.1
MTRARAAVHSARIVRPAGEDGSPSRHLSASSTPRGPASPSAAALFAMSPALALRAPPALVPPATNDETSTRQPPCAPAAHAALGTSSGTCPISSGAPPVVGSAPCPRPGVPPSARPPV